MNNIFENNKQKLLLINEIVDNYRKQNFFCWFFETKCITEKK